jgi:hypothetical protein
MEKFINIALCLGFIALMLWMYYEGYKANGIFI